MLSYLTLLLIPLAGIVSPRRLTTSSRVFIWWLVGMFFAFFIGLRFQIGPDWHSYIGYFNRAAALSFIDLFLQNDPGYYLVNWLAEILGGNIYWVNSFCGAALMMGVIRFSRRQPLPWLALFVAVPYLIIVVGMGYSRQAIAIGFVLLGFASLGDGKIRVFILWVLVGAAFHKSAVLMIPIAALSTSKNKVWNFLWIGVISLIGGYLFLFDSVDTLWGTYVESASYDSQGGLIRVAMNAIPAICYFTLYRRLALKEGERQLWFWMSIFSIACIPLVIISSTATDRVALYLIPLQLFMFSRIHLITKDLYLRSFIVFGVISYYLAVFFVWFVFGSHSVAWLPYKNIVFQP